MPNERLEIMAAKTIDNKLRIRQAAQNLFREKGYSAASMRDLAVAVGIEPATLYSHIKSKEEILQRICFELADEFFKALEKATESATRADLLLAAAIEAHLDVIARKNDAAAVFFHEWRHLSEPCLNDFKLMRRRYEQRFRQIIADGISAGIFNKVDIKFTVLTLFSAMNWTYDIGSKKLKAKDIAEQLCNIFFTGLINKNQKTI